jgi:hypothetical protein
MGNFNLGFLIFYVAFYTTILIIGQLGYTQFGVMGYVTAPPQIAGSPGLFDYVLFVFSFLGYFFGLQGLTVFGIPALYAVLITIPLTTGIFYIVLRLVRGSG